MQCVSYTYDMTLLEGGTYDKLFLWKTGTSPSYAAVDLGGCSATMTIRSKITNDVALISLPFVDATWVADGTSGVYITGDGSTGEYRIYIKDNDSLGLCAAHKDISGVYDLFISNALGETILKQSGACTILAAVTR